MAAYARDLRLDARPRARPLRRRGRDRRLPRRRATRFDRAMAAFAEAYADQNDADYAALRQRGRRREDRRRNGPRRAPSGDPA